MRDGDEYVINGRKWYTTGATDPRCKICIFMGKTDPAGPAATTAIDDPGAEGYARGCKSFGRCPCFGFYRRAGSGPEVSFENVRVPVATSYWAKDGDSRSRRAVLGPAASITACAYRARERVLEGMCRRAERVAFGKPIAEQTVTFERIAEARIMIEQARLLTLKAAYMMDTVGNKAARQRSP